MNEILTPSARKRALENEQVLDMYDRLRGLHPDASINAICTMVAINLGKSIPTIRKIITRRKQ